MQAARIQYEYATKSIAAMCQPVSVEAARPYLKVAALVMTLLVSWAVLCTV
jgi:hypothetical protein